MVERVR